MSEREFDIYLNLLSRFLKLSAKQRRAIEAELRDHLEHRLDELLAKGYTRDDAIAAALEEFGDAAGLADEFSRIARHARIRRRIMQTSIGTLAAAAAIALAFTFLLPDNRSGVPQGPRVTAEQAPSEKAVDDEPAPLRVTEDPAANEEQRLYEQTRAKLDKRIPVDFIETPLRTVLDFFADASEVSLHAEWNVLELANVDADTPITMRLGEVSVKTALERVLRTVSAEFDRVSWGIRDDIVLISTERALEQETRIHMYNVRDLVRAAAASDTAARAEPPDDRGSARTQQQRRIGRGPAGELAWRVKAVDADRMTELMSLIRTHTGRFEAWQHHGGDVGQISAFGEVLIIEHTPEVHEQIRRLLEKLRAAKQAGNDALSRTGAAMHVTDETRMYELRPVDAERLHALVEHLTLSGVADDEGIAPQVMVVADEPPVLAVRHTDSGHQRVDELIRRVNTATAERQRRAAEVASDRQRPTVGHARSQQRDAPGQPTTRGRGESAPPAVAPSAPRPRRGTDSTNLSWQQATPADQTEDR